MESYHASAAAISGGSAANAEGRQKRRAGRRKSERVSSRRWPSTAAVRWRGKRQLILGGGRTFMVVSGRDAEQSGIVRRRTCERAHRRLPSSMFLRPSSKMRLAQVKRLIARSVSGLTTLFPAKLYLMS